MTEADRRFTPVDPEGGLVLATRLPGTANDFDGSRRGWADLAAPVDGPALWVHLDRTKPRAQQWLRDESGLEPLVSAAMLAEETRPRFQLIGDGMLVILRGVNHNPGPAADDLIAVRVWIQPTRVITARQYRFRSIAALRAAAQEGRAPATPGAFLAALASRLGDNLAPSVEQLESTVDDIEQEMLDGDGGDNPVHRSTLARVRRQAISYRRYMVPQRDTLFALAGMSSPLFTTRDAAELRTAGETVARVTEALEEIRDRAAVTQDELRARQEARMSRTLYMLTIVATIALPLGLVTGLLGINVGGMPGVDSSWAFAIVCVGLVVLATVEMIVFKAMKWL